MKSKSARDSEDSINNLLKKHASKCDHYSSVFESLIRQCYEANQSIELLHWFVTAYESYQKNTYDKKIDINQFQPLKIGGCDSLANLNHKQNDYEKIIKKCAVIKLNGGLGTSMGCEGPKSLISVTKTKRFIDIILDQQRQLEKQYQTTIPFLMMNSFYTHDHMLVQEPNLTCFLQHRIPRLIKSSLTPLATDSMVDWCPPGHGNIYLSLYESGLLDQLINEGKEVVFISNSDNLGATVDPVICDYFCDKSLDFLMEVTPRTDSDKKGGSIGYHNNTLSLIERVQVPNTQIEAFEDSNHFQYFNTNSIWVRLKAIKQLIEKKQLSLPLMINQKTVANKEVIQFETAMGAAISCFKKRACIHVERNRFFPVKKTSDLFLLQSNLVIKNDNGTLQWLAKKALPTILLSQHYDTIESYNTLVKCVPDLRLLKSLQVNGPVIFSDNVTLSGDVIITNQSKKPIVLKNLEINNKELTY